MRFTPSVLLAVTAVASAESSPKADTARKLGNNNNNGQNWNGGNNNQNWNGNNYNQNGNNYNQNWNNQNGNGDPEDEQEAYDKQYNVNYQYQYGNENINAYMQSMNHYKQVRDQQYSWTNYNNPYAEGEEGDDRERQDWQGVWGVASSTFGADTSWMHDYNVKFDGCAVDYDADAYRGS